MLLGRIPESSVYIAGVGEGVRWATGQRPGYTLRGHPVRNHMGVWRVGQRRRPRGRRRWPTRQTPSQGLGRERAEINTRLSPLVAPGFFAWHRARAGLGILYALPITAL